MTATDQLLTLLGHIGDWKVWLPVYTSNYRLTNDGVKLGSRGRVSSAQLMEENVALKDLNPNSTFISCRRQDWQKFILELKHEHVVSYLCATYSFRLKNNQTLLESVRLIVFFFQGFSTGDGTVLQRHHEGRLFEERQSTG